MLVTVTGGTGLVGSHSVAAIVAAGHRVRLLVRDEAVVPAALAPLGVRADAVDLVHGDVTDPVAVARALRGADAVLHAASVFSFDSRRRADVLRTNEHGTRLVLDAARRTVTGPVVHVSSVVALFPARQRVVDVDSPVGRSREAYTASKAAAERIARAHQADGAPVVISYPPALLGPHDPKLGDQATRVRNVLRGLMPVWPTGGLPVGDVRDTAALHAALLGPALPGRAGPGGAAPGGEGPDRVRPGGGAGSGRHFGPGHYLTTRQYVRALREVTGRALPTAYLPARAMLPVGRAADLLQRVWPRPIPAEYGAIYTCACATRIAAGDDAGTTARPVADTMRDTVAWLHTEGHLTDRQAGTATATPRPVPSLRVVRR